MTPAALYARAPETIDNVVGNLKGCYYDHLKELEDVLPYEDPNKRVQLRYYKDFNFDGRRYWRLASVWYETKDCQWKPFMIIQNAGREGDDHYKRFITDLELFHEAIRYLKTICPVLDRGDPEIVGLEDDIPELTRFYGNELDGSFMRYR